MKLNANILRDYKPTLGDLSKVVRRNIYIIVDNVLDTYNVGAIFRLADAVGAGSVYLCGNTSTPPYHKIHKASVGTWKWVPWEYTKTARDAVLDIKNQIANIKIIAIEQSDKSIPYTKADYSLPVAFIIGNETEGVSPSVLAMADSVIEIPMLGINKSLNVMASLAIILYKAVEFLERK